MISFDGMKSSNSSQPTPQVQMNTNQELSDRYNNIHNQDTVTINVNEDSSDLHLTQTNLQVNLF